MHLATAPLSIWPQPLMAWTILSKIHTHGSTMSHVAMMRSKQCMGRMLELCSVHEPRALLQLQCTQCACTLSDGKNFVMMSVMMCNS
jgi:hypothetical protein